MPIREFECEDCGHLTEYIMFHKSKLTAIKCEECGGKAKLVEISVSNFNVKGFNAKNRYSHVKDNKKKKDKK
jgi:putative FmdB family regulatory protein